MYLEQYNRYNPQMHQKIIDLAPQIFEEVQKAKKILLHCHPNPDCDSAGSSLAWMYYLKSLGKEVTVIIGDSVPAKNLSVLPGYEQIEPKNYFEIKPEEFDLFIINDAADITRVSSKGEVVFPKSMKTIVIDHHPSNPGFAEINLVVDEYIAAGQIIFELFKLWKVEITREIAVNLIMSIHTDSGGLKYAPTSSETLRDYADLVDIVPDYHDVIFKYENMKDREELKFQGLVLNSIEEYFSNQVALVAISLDKLLQNKINPQNAYGQANRLISVPDWKIGITLFEKEKNVIAISCRTADSENFDLSVFTQAIGGGGHKAAAGATLKMSLPDAKKLLLDKITELFPDLGKA